MKEELHPTCPIRTILSRISDKWSLLVLFTLCHESPLRYNSIRREIPDISQKMLTNTLHHLEEDGLVRRKVYAEVPPRVEYSVTERGATLLPLIQPLVDWAKDNMADILNDRTADHNV